MGDADELLFVPEGDDAMPVLKPDRARGLQARYADAYEFIEEDAVVRVAPAFRHKLKLRLARHLCGIIIPQAIAATTSARNRVKSDTGPTEVGLAPYLGVRLSHLAAAIDG